MMAEDDKKASEQVPAKQKKDHRRNSILKMRQFDADTETATFSIQTKLSAFDKKSRRVSFADITDVREFKPSSSDGDAALAIQSDYTVSKRGVLIDCTDDVLQSNIVASAKRPSSFNADPELINEILEAKVDMVPHQLEDLDRSRIFSGEYSDSTDSTDLNQSNMFKPGEGNRQVLADGVQIEYLNMDKTVIGCHDMDMTSVFCEPKRRRSSIMPDSTCVFEGDMELTSVLTRNANLNKTAIVPVDMEMTVCEGQFEKTVVFDHGQSAASDTTTTLRKFRAYDMDRTRIFSKGEEEEMEMTMCASFSCARQIASSAALGDDVCVGVVNAERIKDVSRLNDTCSISETHTQRFSVGMDVTGCYKGWEEMNTLVFDTTNAANMTAASEAELRGNALVPRKSGVCPSLDGSSAMARGSALRESFTQVMPKLESDGFKVETKSFISKFFSDNVSAAVSCKSLAIEKPSSVGNDLMASNVIHPTQHVPEMNESTAATLISVNSDSRLCVPSKVASGSRTTNVAASGNDEPETDCLSAIASKTQLASGHNLNPSLRELSRISETVESEIASSSVNENQALGELQRKVFLTHGGPDSKSFDNTNISAESQCSSRDREMDPQFCPSTRESDKPPMEIKKVPCKPDKRVSANDLLSFVQKHNAKKPRMAMIPDASFSDTESAVSENGSSAVRKDVNRDLLNGQHAGMSSVNALQTTGVSRTSSQPSAMLQSANNMQSTGISASSQPSAMLQSANNMQSTGISASSQPSVMLQSANNMQSTGISASSQPSAMLQSANNMQSTGISASSQPSVMLQSANNMQSTGISASSQPSAMLQSANNMQSTGISASSQPSVMLQSANNMQSTGISASSQPSAMLQSANNMQSTGISASSQPSVMLQSANNMQSTGISASSHPSVMLQSANNMQSTGISASSQPSAMLQSANNMQSTGISASSQPSAVLQSANIMQSTGILTSSQPSAMLQSANNMQSTGISASSQPSVMLQSANNMQSTGISASSQPSAMLQSANNMQSTGISASSQPSAMLQSANNMQSTGISASSQPSAMLQSANNMQSTGISASSQPSAMLQSANNMQSTGISASSQPSAMLQSANNMQSTGISASSQPSAVLQSANNMQSTGILASSSLNRSPYVLVSQKNSENDSVKPSSTYLPLAMSFMPDKKHAEIPRYPVLEEVTEQAFSTEEAAFAVSSITLDPTETCNTRMISAIDLTTVNLSSRSFAPELPILPDISFNATCHSTSRYNATTMESLEQVDPKVSRDPVTSQSLSVSSHGGLVYQSQSELDQDKGEIAPSRSNSISFQEAKPKQEQAVSSSISRSFACSYTSGSKSRSLTDGSEHSSFHEVVPSVGACRPRMSAYWVADELIPAVDLSDLELSYMSMNRSTSARPLSSAYDRITDAEPLAKRCKSDVQMKERDEVRQQEAASTAPLAADNSFDLQKFMGRVSELERIMKDLDLALRASEQPKVEQISQLDNEISLLSARLSSGVKLQSELEQVPLKVVAETNAFLVLEKEWELESKKYQAEALEKLRTTGLKEEALQRLVPWKLEVWDPDREATFSFLDGSMSLTVRLAAENLVSSMSLVTTQPDNSWTPERHLAIRLIQESTNVDSLQQVPFDVSKLQEVLETISETVLVAQHVTADIGRMFDVQIDHHRVSMTFSSVASHCSFTLACDIHLPNVLQTAPVWTFTNAVGSVRESDIMKVLEPISPDVDYFQNVSRAVRAHVVSRRFSRQSVS